VSLAVSAKNAGAQVSTLRSGIAQATSSLESVPIDAFVLTQAAKPSPLHPMWLELTLKEAENGVMSNRGTF